MAAHFAHDPNPVSALLFRFHGQQIFFHHSHRQLLHYDKVLRKYALGQRFPACCFRPGLRGV